MDGDLRNLVGVVNQTLHELVAAGIEDSKKTFKSCKEIFDAGESTGGLGGWGRGRWLSAVHNVTSSSPEICSRQTAST